MDVVRLLLGVSAILVLSACSQKTSSSVFTQSSAQCAGQKIENKFIVYWEDGRFTVEHSPDAETFKREFVEPNLALIRQVEHDRVIKMETPAQTAAPSSSDFWGQNQVEADALWNEGITGSGVLVGVVDSTVDTDNAQLASRIAINDKDIPGNGIDDDGNGYVDDTYGVSFVSNPVSGMNPHGTHVSGIILADSTKGYMKGMAPGAKLVAAPFLNNDKDGSGDLGDAIRAMQYAASRGVKIINASWGGAPCVPSLTNAFADLSRKGVLLVVAAGNSGADLDRSPSYPAAFNFPNQITVGASDVFDYMASFSNSSFSLVHLTAPGVNVFSTTPFGTYETMSGTSMAAPFVSGAAALLWSARPNATASQIRQALVRGVDVVPGKQSKTASQGRLNVRKALEELKKLVN